MSRATRRKHNMRDYHDYTPPTESQQIVKIIQSRGNNLHEVETPEGTRFLVSMPTRFRKSIWVKRNNFVVIDPIKEGVKVKGEIVKILTNDHIKYYKEDKIWPFSSNNIDTKESGDEEDDIPVNTNRKSLYVHSDSDDSNDSDESDEDSDTEISANEE